MKLRAARVLTPEGVVAPGEIEIDGDRIASVSAASGPAPDLTLVPGFVDLQVNGHGSADVVTSSDAEWAELEKALLAQGVTTWCPAVTTRPLDDYGPILDRLAERAALPGGPTVAGVHLEGPFLSPHHAGAHPPEHCVPVDHAWLGGLPELVRVVTLAPELPGALDAVEALARRGVLVALGHSGASAEQAREAAGAGARLVTHLFNAMGGLHHRDPGLVGAALTDARLTVSLIADLVHVAPEMLALAVSSKGADRVALVTDATADGAPGLRGPAVVSEGAPRLADGALAGSALTMDRAVVNLAGATGLSLPEAARSASTVPARLLGLDEWGALAPAKRADIVALDPEGRIVGVWLGGREVAGPS